MEERLSLILCKNLYHLWENCRRNSKADLSLIICWTGLINIYFGEPSVIGSWCCPETATFLISFSWDWLLLAALKLGKLLSVMDWNFLPDNAILHDGTVHDTSFQVLFTAQPRWQHINDVLEVCSDHAWNSADRSGVQFSVSLSWPCVEPAILFILRFSHILHTYS